MAASRRSKFKYFQLRETISLPLQPAQYAPEGMKISHRVVPGKQPKTHRWTFRYSGRHS